MRRSAIILSTIATFAATTPVWAAPGDILIRVRGDYVVRTGSSDVTVSVGGSPVTAKAKGAVGGEASLTFFMTDHLATEFTLGGAPYDLKDSSGHTLISAGLITPTAMLQYHLMPNGRAFRPYIGAGLSYANFGSVTVGEVLTNRTVVPAISYSASINGALAPVVQIGADVAINEQMYINFDAKCLGTNSKLTLVQGGNSQTVSHKMRSCVLGTGVGFRF